MGSEIIEYDISSLSLDNLFKSLKNLITSKLNDRNKFEEKMIVNLEEDDYSAEDAYTEISQTIQTNEEVEFNHLLKNKFSKSRIVTLFLCILDMFKNGEIDLDNMKKFIEGAQDIPITFHRAFDVCREPLKAFYQLQELGVQNILTSGQSQDCLRGKKLLKELVKISTKNSKNKTEIANTKKIHIQDGVAIVKFMYWLKNNYKKENITEFSAEEKITAAGGKVEVI